jgi:adenine-specific DNA methylase
MPLWKDMFSPRQLLVHGASVELFRALLDEEKRRGLTECTRAAFIYLALALDKLRDYNSRMTRWHANREVMVNTFDRHDFSFKWSYAEMVPLVAGVGQDWAISQIEKCVAELIELIQPNVASRGDLVSRASAQESSEARLTISCKSGSQLDHIADASVDAVVMDPPYYDNVMYAELSDFFYVWLKRTAGEILPELFVSPLTDKDGEAVANPSRFAGRKGAKALAGRDYQEKMQGIFDECRRVLKPDGIMTLLFTHKATGAWDALTTGLVKAGFAVSASWPVNTEAEGSLHVKDRAAANSTIFLACRPRASSAKGAVSYWEEIEPIVARSVRARVEEFQKAGIGGVDLYLACFGPALEEFSKHWPLTRGTPRPEPPSKRRQTQAELFEEEIDPYGVTPEDALEAARREVKTWRLQQLTHMRGKEDLDPATSFYVLAWDAFKAPVFAYDEGLRLARAVGADLDQLVGRLCEKKGSDIKLWDSKTRAEKGALGAGDGSRGLIDALQYAAHLGRTRSLEAARQFIKDAGLAEDTTFLNALEAILEVLPPSSAFTNVKLSGDLETASADFDALEKLRRLAFADRVDEPKQLSLWKEESAT